MWGFLGLGLSYLVDSWSRNTPKSVDSTRKFYARQKELAQMDEWERRMYLLVEKQKKEGFTGENMYRQYFIEWRPSKAVYINRFELEISEAFSKSDLSLEVFIAEYMEGRIEEFMRRTNSILFIYFNVFDKYGNSVHCSVKEPYKCEDIENYYNVELRIGRTKYDKIPRRKE